MEPVGFFINLLVSILFQKPWHIYNTESLVNTDSQALKHHEMKGYAKKWQYAKFPLHIAMYLDVLTPLKVLSVSLQQEKHDPVYMLRNVHEFNWLMSKLQLLVENAFEGFNQKANKLYKVSFFGGTK